MTETLTLEIPELIDFASRIVRDGVAPNADRGLTCVWGRDPGTGRLESHWVTAPPTHYEINDGVL